MTSWKRKIKNLVKLQSKQSLILIQALKYQLWARSMEMKDLTHS